jgi:hypothetical protein
MTDQSRIYLVTKRDGSEPRLVRASNRFVAHRHVTSSAYVTHLASQEDFVRLLPLGLTVEQAGADGVTSDLFEPEEQPQPTLRAIGQ